MITVVKKIIWGSLLASFFIFFALADAESEDNIKKIYISNVWHALLHMPDDKSLILDPEFVSQADENSAYLQINKTIQDLFKNNGKINKDLICKFPARYIWLSQQLNYQVSSPENLCSDFRDYIYHVPIDDVYLVYAAENVTQPSSMMGHVFLKFEGKNYKNKKVSHAISFYTKVDSFNMPKLMYETLVLGKKGYFLVSPYREKVITYNDVEQRNIFEYKLKLTDFQKRLIQAHMWEIKSANLDYFFHKFNCATLTNDILGIISKDILKNSSSWLTPLDVVKGVNKANIVESVTMLPSPRWKIRMLQDAIGVDSILSSAYAWDFNVNSIPKMSPKTEFLFTELVDSYNQFLLNDGKLSLSDYEKNIEHLKNKVSIDGSKRKINLVKYKDPISRPQDSQWGIGINSDGEVWGSFLPASHLLSDDHRSSFAETELQLLSTKISYKNKIKLESLVLYGISSLVPYDKFSGGVSGKFKVGAKQFDNEFLEDSLSAYVSGALGRTMSIHRDSSIYGMIRADILSKNGGRVSYGLEVGGYIYDVFNQKTLIEYSVMKSQFKTNNWLHNLRLEHSWFFNEKNTLVLSFSNKSTGVKSMSEIGFEWRNYF